MTTDKIWFPVRISGDVSAIEQNQQMNQTNAPINSCALEISRKICLLILCFI